MFRVCGTFVENKTKSSPLPPRYNIEQLRTGGFGERKQWKGKCFLSGPNQSKITIIPLKNDQKFPFRVNSQGQFCSQLNCWINKTTDLNRLTVVLNADRITLTFDNLENRSHKNSGLQGLVLEYVEDNKHNGLRLPRKCALFTDSVSISTHYCVTVPPEGVC